MCARRAIIRQAESKPIVTLEELPIPTTQVDRASFSCALKNVAFIK